MAGTANKRQKRQEYRDTQRRLYQQPDPGQTTGSDAIPHPHPHHHGSSGLESGSRPGPDSAQETRIQAQKQHNDGIKAGGDDVSYSVRRETKKQGVKAAQKREAVAVKVELPKKKFYRQRAHANPFSDHGLE